MVIPNSTMEVLWPLLLYMACQAGLDPPFRILEYSMTMVFILGLVYHIVQYLHSYLEVLEVLSITVSLISYKLSFIFPPFFDLILLKLILMHAK